MEKIGYIDDRAGQRLEVEFVQDKNDNLMPKSKQDTENLISAWNINDEILQGLIEFVNENLKDEKEKITLLTNTKKYVFLDSKEIYNAVTFKTGEEATQREIEAFIDKIYDNAIFGYEGIMLCLKAELE